MNDEGINGTIETMFRNINSREVKQKVLDFMKKTLATQGGAAALAWNNIEWTGRTEWDNTGRTPPNVDQENGRNVRRRIGGAQALGVKYPLTAQLTRQPTAKSPRPVVKPMRNIRRPEQALRKTLRDAFSVQSIDRQGLSDEEVRRTIADMYTDSTITVDMILAYIMLGAKVCKEGVYVLEDESLSGDVERIVGKRGGKTSGGGNVTRSICHVPMSEGMTLIAGKLYVDTSELKVHIHTMVKDIKKNLETVRRLGHDQVFNIVRRTQRGGNNTSPAYSEKFYTPGQSTVASQESVSTLPEADEWMEEAIRELGDLDINEEINDIGYDRKIRLLGSKSQSISKNGERYVMKIGYHDGTSYKHVVVKAALKKSASEGIDAEATIYVTLKKFFKEIYDRNVLQHYGNGLVVGDVATFKNEDGKNIRMNLNSDHNGFAYVALEFNPAHVNVEDFLSYLSSQDMSVSEFSAIGIIFMDHVLTVHKRANEVCEFGHGDLKCDNVLLDTDGGITDTVKMFDLEFSSISGYVSDVYRLYNNTHLIKLLDGDMFEDEYDPIYLWYCDAIRFMTSFALNGVDFRVMYDTPFKDLDLLKLVEVMGKFFLSRRENNEWRRLEIEFNTGLQSHEFISKVMELSRRHINNDNDDDDDDDDDNDDDGPYYMSNDY